MARGNYREYLQGDEVWVKKYFYVLRPILACLWIEKGLGPVPMEFSTLVHRLIENEKLKRDIIDLVEAKKKGTELDRGARILTISEFIDDQLVRLSEITKKKQEAKSLDELDKLFIKILVDLNESTGPNYPSLK
jgi:predicted nucleotidyltransferase